jgi:hypothetical protein
MKPKPLLHDLVREFRYDIVVMALRLTNGDRDRAAWLLGISAGELAITRRISLVAFCWSLASVSSRRRSAYNAAGSALSPAC